MYAYVYSTIHPRDMYDIYFMCYILYKAYLNPVCHKTYGSYIIYMCVYIA